MRPSRTLLYILLAVFLSAIVVALFPQYTQIWVLGAAVVVCVGLADFLMGFRRVALAFERDYPTRYPLGSRTEVTSRIANRSRAAVTLRYYDGIPSHCLHEGFPYTQKIGGGGEFASFTSLLTFQRRGDHVIAPAHIEVLSPLGLWWRYRRLGDELKLQVYPNYEPALKYGLLATSDRLEQMGIVKKRFKGLSKEFHQLRDYQDGDAINQIDWKATSRVNRLITREFQEERDQNIFLVADCSLRTKAVDLDLPILDHLLNAMILISYMAIKQGDKISIANFGVPAEDVRYLPSLKGGSGMAKVLDHLYNYQSTDSYGEYSELTKRLLSYPQKRSLVIILTNLRTEDKYGCVEALRLLSEKHMVLLASVQENSVSQILSKPVETTADAHRYVGATAYEQDAEEIVSDLMQQGINVLRAPIETFGIELANRYLDLRSSIAS